MDASEEQLKPVEPREIIKPRGPTSFSNTRINRARDLTSYKSVAWPSMLLTSCFLQISADADDVENQYMIPVTFGLDATEGVKRAPSTTAAAYTSMSSTRMYGATIQGHASPSTKLGWRREFHLFATSQRSCETPCQAPKHISSLKEEVCWPAKRDMRQDSACLHD